MRRDNMSATDTTRFERAQSEDMDVAMIGLGGQAWVRSQSGETYFVRLDGAESACSCPDHTFRGTTCKHMARVAREEGVLTLGGA